MSQVLHDQLILEAQLIFYPQELVELAPGKACYLYTPSLQTKINLTKFYILLIVHFFENPSILRTFLVNQLPNKDFDLVLFMEVFKSLSMVYRSNLNKYRKLKQIYKLISELADVRLCISKYCSIPEDIAESIPGFALVKVPVIDLEAKSQVTQCDEPAQCTCNEIQSGYSKVAILVANFKQSKNQSEFAKIWENITNIIGYYDLSYLKIFDNFLSLLLGMDRFESCSFILKKFLEALGANQLIKHLLAKLGNKYYEQGETVIFRSRLSQLQHQIGSNCFQNQQTFKALCLLLKKNLIQHTCIFSLLTPPIKTLLKVQEQRVKMQKYYIRKCFKKSLEYEQRPDENLIVWGELLYSSKLELLNHLLLINDFQSFKEIITKNEIKLDLIYHPNIFFTLSKLFEWIYAPLLRMFDYTIHFKNQRPTSIVQFPEGHFKQSNQISYKMLSHLTEIIQIGKSYIFSNKITFVKTCRLFREVFLKASKIPMEDADMKKKVPFFVANLVKNYLLPSVEYYDNDPTIGNELDKLIECFKFKYQFEIYNDCLKERQLSNLQLSYVYETVTSEMVKYINRLTDSDFALNIISKILICHPFSGFFQIFHRFTHISKEQLYKIISVINKSTKLTKKIALFFVFMHICEQENEMIASSSEISKKYELLIFFTSEMLKVLNKDEEFISLVFQYVVYKFSNFNSDVNLLNNFDKFHGEIYFLDGILQNILPIELDQYTIRQYDRKYLVGGPLLKIKLMNKINQFHLNRTLRSNIIKCLFKPQIKCIFDNSFYYIILKLNNIKNFIVRNLSYNITATANLYDKFLKLMLNIINIAHFQANTSEIIKYFKIRLFQPLVLYYQLPYQIAFYIVRKSITELMKTQKYDWNDQKTWLQLKNYFTQHLETYFKDSSADYKGLNYEKFSQLQIDIFLMFWIQDIQYSLFLSIYTDHIQELKESIQKDGFSESLAQFSYELAAERDTFAQIHYDMLNRQTQDGILGKHIYNEKYLISVNGSNNPQSQYSKFCGMFIKYCIFPRAMLNRSECYYSWCFFFHFLKNNNLPVELTFNLICLFLQCISKFVPYSTQRESLELLPLLYNSSTFLFGCWSNFNKFNDKLEKHKLVKNRLYHQDYLQIINIVYESQTNIINYLLQDKNQVYSVKNCISFICKCQHIPFCSEHGQIIINGFNHLKDRYRDHKDFTTAIESCTKELMKKIEGAKSIKNYIKSNREKSFSQSERQSHISFNATIPIFYQQEKVYDPLKEYPDLLTYEEDYNVSMLQASSKKSYKKNGVHAQPNGKKDSKEQQRESSKKRKQKTTSKQKQIRSKQKKQR